MRISKDKYFSGHKFRISSLPSYYKMKIYQSHQSWTKYRIDGKPYTPGPFRIKKQDRYVNDVTQMWYLSPNQFKTTEYKLFANGGGTIKIGLDFGQQFIPNFYYSNGTS